MVTGVQGPRCESPHVIGLFLLMKSRVATFLFFFQGTPVNRVPIMAKQTLDLFKLFKLVVDKGGLVEVSVEQCSFTFIVF